MAACAWLAATDAVLELDDSLDVDADDELELDDLEEALAFDDDCLVLTLTPTSAWWWVGRKKTIAKANKRAGRVNAKIR